ncbi:MAG: SUMF1/EgtB/PvdO family nonheme iron enzyme [Chitinispirillales bacterium]|nr:SUMF1/EgtB/PvdO family nonheme iron enzyme [Chitinispirillales bacterium]
MTDPTGPATGSNRVRRGGSWSNNAGHCRVSYRGINTPGYRLNGIGFRLVLSL